VLRSGAGNSTVFGAPPSAPTLPNAALVAGDPSKYALRASIEGTEFGAATLRAALPSSINLVAPGIACSPANLTAASGTGEHQKHGLKTRTDCNFEQTGMRLEY
jgi:hypothetical protein